MVLDIKWAELPIVRKRFLISSAFVGLVFLLLLLRLWYLQVVNYDEFLERSVRNRTRVLSLEAPRGPVYDRNGQLLVDNRPSFQISVMRQDIENRELLFTRLAEILDVDVEELEKRWNAGKGFPIYRPVPLATDVSWDIMEKIQEQGGDLPGVLTEVRPIRDYLDQGISAHLIGYLGEITEDELGQEEFSGYRAGDFVGKTALERSYEEYLRGTKGTRLVEVDVKGKLLRQLQMDPPRPGNRVYLTIDENLQRAADEAFGDESGAAVAIDVHSGDVLAMVSRPTFNPALFVTGIGSDQWTELALNKRHPLQNKVVAGQYPPGSTFKMIVALAALRDGMITAGKTVDCEGDFTIGEARYRCWKKDGHGETDLKKALRESCDVWFYQVGLELGIDKLSAAAKELGLGGVVGYPLPGERGGVIPSQEWKRQRFNKPWYAGETVIASIGQGFVLATPLQLAVMTAAIANRGTVLKPRVIDRVEDWEGNLLVEPGVEVVRQVDYPEKAWDVVQEGMVAVVNEPHGTGRAAELEDVLVAGKSGTSQVVRRKSDEEEEEEEDDNETPYRLRPHALFVAYAPADNPEIAVAVVVEHGQSGGRAAGPVAKAIIESYMAGKKSSEEQVGNN
ncbi:MAG: penicillin-binding protein 2 [Desulfuromonas sp.]|nr:MAG: penicillin-binding protein 2 [Desulfuromonas sp.]